MSETCVHCGVVVELRNVTGPPLWAHRIGEGSYLNRCQSPDVPYGHEAHPDHVECPAWCLGNHETPYGCTHRAPQ